MNSFALDFVWTIMRRVCLCQRDHRSTTNDVDRLDRATENAIKTTQTRVR